MIQTLVKESIKQTIKDLRRMPVMALMALMALMITLAIGTGITLTHAQTPTPSNSVPIQGKIVNLELTNVRDILLDVERAQGAAAHLFDEVTRHPVTTTFRANVIGATVISMPQPSFDMSQMLPARKTWVDTYMNEIKPIVGYMKQDLDAIRTGETELRLDEKQEAKLRPLLTEWAAGIDKGAECTAALTKLTAAQSYDNSAIAVQAAELHKVMKAMTKTGKRVVDILKKSARSGQ